MHYVPGLIRKETVVSKLAVATMLAGLWTLPQSASAQLDEEATTPEPNLQEPAPSTEAPSNEGGLSPRVRKRTRKQWDPNAYDVQPTSKRKTRGDVRPTSKRKTHSRPGLGPGIGLGVSLAVFGGGIAMVVIGTSELICISFGDPCSHPDWAGPVLGTGVVLMIGGIAGIIVSSTELADSTGHRTSSRAPKHRKERRAKWDSKTSRLVF